MATAEADIQNKIRKDKKSSKEILDENVSAEDENIKAEEIKLSSEEELESLLKLAEDLKEKCDKTENGIRKWKFLRAFEITTFLILLLLPFSIFPRFLWRTSRVYSEINTVDIFSLLIVVGLYILLAMVIINSFFIKNLKKSYLADKLALKEVLQLLREVHGTIAEREDWSILKRAEFRIRLSRFDLSEKKESVFSFFS